MKTIDWDPCSSSGAIDIFPKVGEWLGPTAKVEPGMYVSAKYKGNIISLRIEEELKPGSFRASVLDLYSLNESKPVDLSEAEEVLIDRGHICWVTRGS